MQSHTSIASKVQLTTLLFLCTLALADHYKTLGVTKDATDTAIKKAYRKLALKHHPDKATNEKDRAAAEVTFATIGEAYETLKDPTTRAQYDDSLRPKAAQFGGAQRGFFEGTSGGSRFRAAPSVFDFPDPSTMWDTAGGSMFGGGQQRAAQKPVQLYPPAVLLTTAKMRALTRLARGDTVWVVHFFTKTSHGCQQLSKSLMQLHNKLQGLVSVAAVDCDAEQALCEAQRVSQFPLVKILSASPGVHQLSATDELTESALTVSCLKAIPSHVIDLRRAAHKAQFFDMCDKEATQGCVLLFTDKYDTTPLYKRLSSVFKGQLLLGIVRGAHNSELAESLGVSSFPTLQYRKSLSSPPTIYGGIVKFEQIKAFLQHRLQ